MVDLVNVCTNLLAWLAWIFVVLGDSYDLDTHTWDPSVRVIRQQDFWYCFGMTALSVFAHAVFVTKYSSPLTTFVSILIPWFTVREVTVDIEVVSTIIEAHED